ncbi:MAG: DUF4367 domain-containing protein [Paenibacillus dendritiformis]|uniref:DUF4367 domain-containing protein n=1 Tax=uncultured Paenibacillus sp. TaxID=227322 RepID=UPI0025FF73BF|nr:DUF4367 domain-containing protein [uncultured Paenibacillus sp.]MDU5145407.1 DUF4367 domain-containing protein [Paenibacillus dendritiformis]
MNNQNKMSDEQLKELLNRAHRSVEIPDGKQSWLEVKARLDRIKKRKRWFYRIKISVMIACVSLIISFALTTDLPTVYSHFSSLIKNVHENIVNIFFDEPKDPQIEEDSEAKTSAPPSILADIDSSEGEGLWSEDTSLDDAEEKLLFHLAVPTYIPAGYNLDLVRIYKDTDGAYRTAFMEYVNEVGRIIQLNQRMISDESTPVISTIHQSSTFKDVVINDNIGVMITHENDFIHLEWLTSERIKLSLFGLLSEDEILLMANSLQ